ncbi:hypothetical protein TSUD_320260 [Trifolium subterraneum]|uniref:Reverse transcriptase zinc-binding domain-containing protein n=1 Tax=Trifolium subterraneum TaxID=3900 RepID=A0A2Z6N176_TRISU|nr:hypothetical protein TSUD_320260 [Trifolium subterraneum]
MDVDEQQQQNQHESQVGYNTKIFNRRAGDWILDVFKKKLGNGGSTRFWLDHWVGVAPLKEVFPRLYSISLQMDLTIQEIGEWVNDKWVWHIKWRRIFFTWEEELARNLWNIIGERFAPSSTLGQQSLAVVAQVWESWAPSKVIIFSWQALLGRLPTRDNLARRGIIPLGVGTRCPWGDGDIESENHILVTCPLAWAVWSLVHKWFGIKSVVPSTISSMCESFLKVYRKGKNGSKGVLLV